MKKGADYLFKRRNADHPALPGHRKKGSKTLIIFLALLFAVICLATSSIMLRFCTAPAAITAFYRLCFTALIIALMQAGSVYRGFRSLSRPDLLRVAAGGTFLAMHLAFWMQSLKYTSISSSVLFTNLQVIFVVLFSLLFLKDRLNPQLAAGIVIALAGSLIIGGGDLRQGKIFGDLLALASGLFIAVYLIIGKDVLARVNIMTYTVLVSGAAALTLLLYNGASGVSLWGYPQLDWLIFFGNALLPGIGGHLVLNWVLKQVKAPVASVAVLGESVGASILAFLIFQEALGPYQILGGGLILSGIVTAANSERTIKMEEGLVG